MQQRGLERKLRLFRRVVEASGHAIYFADRRGVIEYVNPAFEASTGYTAEEAIGRTPRILKSGHHDSAFYEALWETILSGQVWRSEIINETKAGDEYVVDQTIAPVRGESGEIEHFVAINADVTDRTEYEERIERENDRLEEFASVVSHDLRNPLNVARGRLELAREECDSEHLDVVERAHQRMEALIDDLLTAAKVGRTAMDTERVPLADVVRDCWTHVETASASLVVDTDLVAPADRSRLQQLLANLFRNAVEHGGDDVTVTVGPLDRGFYVEDDGRGVDAADRSQVFEAGYSTATDGTGFGLNIVKQAVDAHGWSVRVAEGTEGGARFEITGLDPADG